MLGFASLSDIAGLTQGSFPEASANALGSLLESNAIYWKLRVKKEYGSD